MQKYSTYKPSNVEWLGEVPIHWKVSEIKHDLEFTTGFTPPTSNAELFDGDITWVTIADMDQKYISNSKTKLTAEAVANAKAQIIPKGSLLYSFKLSIGKVAFAETDLYTNEAIACFLPNVKFNPNFLYYAFETYLHNYGKENIYGALLLNREIIKAAKITYPKFSEQTAIAAYLDQATANIDQVISTKQKQLEKLEQYKQSKIHECVTKGLNPDVTQKPSGIDWIGNVPSHWKVWRLKDEAEYILTGSTPSTSVSEYYDNGTIKWFAPGSFNGEVTLDDAQKLINKKALDDGELKLFPKGCLFLIGIGATIGKVAMIEEDSSCNQQLNVIKPTVKLESRYLIYFMKIYEDIIPKISQFTTLPIFNQTKTGQLNICIPPKKEQADIAKYLDHVSLNIKKEKSIIEQQIEKLKQYRKCLIHECVTGKRKVVND